MTLDARSIADGGGWRLYSTPSRVVVEIRPPIWRVLALVALRGLGLTGLLALAAVGVGTPAAIGAAAWIILVWGTGTQGMAFARERLTIGLRRIELDVLAGRTAARRRITRGADLNVELSRRATTPVAQLLGFGVPLTLSSLGHSLRFGRGLTKREARELAGALRDAVRVERAPPRGRGRARVRRVGQLRVDGEPTPYRRSVLGTRLSRSGRVIVWAAVLALALMISDLPRTALDVWGAAVAVATASFGLAWAVEGVVSWLRRRSARRRQPLAPWTWTPLWRAGIVRRGSLRRVLRDRSMLQALPFALLAASTADASAPWVAVVIAGVSAAGIVPVVFGVWQAAFGGVTEVRFDAVPYAAGERVRIHFAVHQGGALFESIRFVLRRVELRGSQGVWNDELLATHAGTYELPDDRPPPGPGEEVTADFELSEDAGGTRAGNRAPVWWELCVTGGTSCGAYDETFPVPVYDVPPSVKAPDAD